MSKAYRAQLLVKAKAAASDYAEATRMIGRYCKNSPFRATTWAGLAAAIYYISSQSPSRNHYTTALTQHQDEINLLPIFGRKQSSNQYIQRMTKLRDEGLLDVVNLGLFSILRQTRYSNDLRLYPSQVMGTSLPSIEPMEATQTSVLDFGFMGHWWKLEEAMEDFDIAE
eukprot:CFRG1309T1